MSTYTGWACVELMGYRVRYGQVFEVEQYGTKMLRIDVPNPAAPDEPVSEFYGGPSIYSVTPMTEEMVRDKIGDRDIRPVKPVSYRLPHSEPVAAAASSDDDDGKPF